VALDLPPGLTKDNSSMPDGLFWLRLSCDVRWQPDGDPEDDRWFGDPPAAHGGLSYGGVNSAQPLGAAYIAR